jgi:hypothetical protein
VTPPPHRRLVAIVGLLLTPVVAWAASFLAGWLGSLLAARIDGDRAAFLTMALFALGGAAVGTIVWIKALVRYRVPLIHEEPEEPG